MQSECSVHGTKGPLGAAAPSLTSGPVKISPKVFGAHGNDNAVGSEARPFRPLSVTRLPLPSTMTKAAPARGWAGGPGDED